MLKWFDIGSEGFVRLAAVELLDAKGLAMGADQIYRYVGKSGVLDWRAAAGEVPVDEVVLAFRQLQGAAAGT